MPVVLPSIKKKSFHWSACLYASRLFLGTKSLHLDLLMSVKTPDSQVGGTTASLEICVILVQLSNAYSPIALTLSPDMYFLQVGAFAKSFATYCRNTIGNGYRSQRATIAVSIIS